MGQKVHPTGIRLGVVKDHNSVWYADSKTYAQNLITYNDLWRVIMEKHHLPNEDFDCTCDDYCRYGCKYCRTGCYAYQY